MAVLSGALMGDGQKLRSLGKYHLIASLGQGGMAKVYLGLVAGPEGVNKLMVLKVLENEMLAGPEGGLEIFWDEARLAARLVHPNIVHTYEVGEIDGHYFLAMEHLDGQTYRAVHARSAQSRLPLSEELRIVSEVARGLHYAHELKGYQGESLGVVHRDVSPQNVFITYDGQVRLIDFGIAKTNDAGHSTRVGVIKGKLNYIAPEQLRGDPLDGRADIFALGVMLWEVVSGRSFAGGAKVADVAKVHARIKGDEPNIRSVKPDVPEELAVIIDRALAIDREQRWSDAATFADTLDSYLEWAGERPSARSLSGWMQVIFSEDRSAMHKLIDQQVRALSSRTSDSPIELPRIRLSDELHTSSGVWSGKDGPAEGGAAQPVGAPSSSLAGSEGAKSGWRGLSQSRRNLSMAAVAGVATLGSGLLVIALLSPAEATKPAVGGQSTSNASSAPVQVVVSKATAPVPLVPSQAPSEGPASIVFDIKAFPPEAQVRLDGVLIAAPFSGEFRQTTALHRLEATAPGYEAFAQLIPFDHHRSIEIALKPLAGPARRSGTTRLRGAPEKHASDALADGPVAKTPPSAESESAPAIVPGADISPVRVRSNQAQIDTADPYAIDK